MAELGNDELGRIGINGIVHGGHDVHFHQCLDNLDTALGHAVGQFLNRDGFRNNNFADDFYMFYGTFAALLAFPLPFDGSQ